MDYHTDNKEKELKEKVMNEVLDEIKEKKLADSKDVYEKEDSLVENENKDIAENPVSKESDKAEKSEVKEEATGKTEKSEVKEETTGKTEKSKEKVEKDDISLIPFIDPSVEKFKNKKKKKKKALLITLSAFLLIYFGGVVYCANFFVGNSKINNIDVSYKSINEANDLIQKDADRYTLTVDYRNGSEVMKPADVDGKVVLKKSMKQVKKEQNPFIWFMYFFEDSDLEVGYKLDYSETNLDKYLNSLYYLDRNNMIEPEDAYVRLEDGEAKLIKETDGTVLDYELVKKAYVDAINNFETELVIENEGCYKVANITSESDSVQNTLKKAEDYLDIKAQYDFNGYIYQIPKEELTKMAYIDSNGNVEISETNVKLYAKKFADEFTTYHKDREFYTHDNMHILISGGYYGWQIDEEVEEEELYNEMIQKRDFVKTPACITDAYTLCDMNDIGDNYVEIDLTDQHVYIIRDGKVVYDTLCVSGNESRGMGTPGGVYPITYTQQHAILRGPGYETPVAYWMPFNGGIGMHDATWKSKFGEDYYKYDGSHGCINLSLEAAGKIFPLVEKGMPVVCYWEDEVTYLD